jgi:hypothetical protein
VTWSRASLTCFEYGIPIAAWFFSVVWWEL